MDIESYARETRPLIDLKLAEMARRLHFSRHMLFQLTGGKRLRAVLCLLTCEALGGRREDALEYAAAIEMIHAGTLTHDDYVDRHKVRRGKLPLYAVIGPRKAVLLADLLMSAAIKLTKSEDGSKDALSEAVYNVARGAVMEPLGFKDIASSLIYGSIQEELYESIVKLKAGELFATACKLGAIAAKAPSELRERAYVYGLLCGMAFQVADDLVDLSKLLQNGAAEADLMTSIFPMVAFFSGREAAIELFRKLVLARGPGGVFMLIPGYGAALRAAVIRRERKFLKRVARSAFRYVCEKCRLAREAISVFPESRYRRVLEEFPEYAVRKMLREACKPS
ncbi:MAG: hypothetical protein DRN96_00210 [Thermoproteota archaeon]|nr:MAG: hypothetical protein DRN96_00210 [Candidatus Korarchaeota archaeon]